MRKVGFIGAYDKIDLILYIARLLRILGKKVLVIDSTINQKAKYIVPVINPTVSYVTEFGGVDVAVGFNDMFEVKDYLMIPDEKELDYDIALIDMDTSEALEDFEMHTAFKNYFVTSFDVYSLKRGLEIFEGLKTPIGLTKVLFSRDMEKEEDEYLNYLSMGHRIIWSDYRIYFPLDIDDQCAVMENQKLARVDLKRLSDLYKESLAYIAEELADGVTKNDIKRAMKTIERGI